MSRPISSDWFFAAYPDSTTIEADCDADARDVLLHEHTLALSLDMTLLLFDPDITLDTRGGLAVELGLLIDNETFHDGVLNIVLSKPLPHTADISGALSAAATCAATLTFVKLIVDSQQSVSRTYSTWLQQEATDLVVRAGTERVFTVFSHAGVFRTLALGLIANVLAADFRAHVILNPALSVLPTAARILGPLYDDLFKDKDKGKIVALSSQTRSNSFDGSGDSTDYLVDDLAPHPTVHKAYVATLSQVDHCADLFIRAKDAEARSVLSQLIADNLHYSNGERLAVKSLCNIASKVDHRGRAEIALECLRMALTFPKGADHRLYNQIGSELLSLEEYDEAYNCFELAEACFNGTSDELDKLRIMRTRVLMAKGKYNEVRESYLSIPDFHLKPDVLLELGKYARRFGFWDVARTLYQSCLKLDTSMYQASAGLAEVWKQKGNLHRAIRGYNAIFRDHTHIKDGARRVYNIALSHLLRMVGQYDRSEGIIRRLLRESPYDAELHGELGKLCLVREEYEEARRHFARATDSPVAHVLEAIVEHLNNVHRPSHLETLQFIPRILLPEDPGLGACMAAFDAIVTADVRRAVDLLDRARIVDRFTGDLATVLRYHALRVGGASSEFRHDRALSRLAKRGDKKIRQAILCVSEDAYGAARECEANVLARCA